MSIFKQKAKITGLRIMALLMICALIFSGATLLMNPLLASAYDGSEEELAVSDSLETEVPEELAEYDSLGIDVPEELEESDSLEIGMYEGVAEYGSLGIDMLSGTVTVADVGALQAAISAASTGGPNVIQVSGVIPVNAVINVDAYNATNREIIITGSGSIRADHNYRIFRVISGYLVLDGDIVLDGGSRYQLGGGVRVDTGATMIMRGNAVIENSYASLGGAGYFSQGSFLYMTGNSEIRNNNGRHGGGVYFRNNEFGDRTHIIMSGDASIHNNESTMGGGGGIWAGRYIRIFMTESASINSNSATEGGGIRTEQDAIISIGGDSSLVGNTARTHHGGAINVNIRSTIVLSGYVRIAENSANLRGGGINFATSGTLIMNDRVEIMNNHSMTIGGGVHFDCGSTFTMNGGSISNNEAVHSGGGVSLGRLGNNVLHADRSSMQMLGGQISNNEALEGDGGGIWMSAHATLNVEGGTISNNEALEGDGGGIFTQPYTYESPLPTPLPTEVHYPNLTVAEDVIFTGNQASDLFRPPVDDTWQYTNILETSQRSAFEHALNNFDINFRGGEPVEPPPPPPPENVIRFHLNGSGQLGGRYIAVPVVYYNGRMVIDEDSDEWEEVLEIGHILGYYAPNEMKGLGAPRPWRDLGYYAPEGQTRYAAAFWGWFEAENLDPRTNGRNEMTGLSHIPLIDGEPTRLRPGFNNFAQVHPGNQFTGGPVYAYREDEGLNLDDLLENGFPLSAFENDGRVDFFGIWIRWGDLNDDGITYSSDAAVLHSYLTELSIHLLPVPIDGNFPILHHGAASVTLYEHTYTDSASLLHSFLVDLSLVQIFPELVPNPTRLGTAYPH